jgi:hypothetical protein
MGKKRRWTDEALAGAVVECFSMASVLRALGLKVRGANYDTVRRRLLREGNFPHACQICRQSKWMEQAIPLELDHIDGDREDNLLENLRLICPNCHAQTVNYRGRNTRYDHIPCLADIQAGIARCGSIRGYAVERQVSPDAVRCWLRSPRLKLRADLTPGSR